MKNLRPYSEDCFEVHQNCVTRKQDENLKNRLNNISANIEQEYNIYIDNFRTNTLDFIAANPFFTRYRDDLLSLYGYNTKVIRDVKRQIENQQSFSVRYTCQNCGLDATGAMDHFLPKEAFPVFSVNPLNLIPTCSYCNQYKSNILTTAGRRNFLNLFLDRLPEEQYLFVDVIEDSYGDIDFSFELRNYRNIDPILFELLENHFERLHLFERMKRASISYVSEFQNTVKSALNHLTIEQITEIQIAKSFEDRVSYGFNYWKAALEIALIHSPIFLARVS